MSDGVLITCDRVAGTIEQGDGLRYSDKGRRSAGNLQFLTAPEGHLLWVSAVEPGSVHDLRAARIHALPAPYAAVRHRLPAPGRCPATPARASMCTPRSACVRSSPRPWQRTPGPTTGPCTASARPVNAPPPS